MSQSAQGDDRGEGKTDRPGQRPPPEPNATVRLQESRAAVGRIEEALRRIFEEATFGSYEFLYEVKVKTYATRNS